MNRIEPFPAKNALQVDKQKFLTSFLGRFGAFMRKHGLHKAFQSHLTVCPNTASLVVNDESD
jgi:hypothetical protein